MNRDGNADILVGYVEAPGMLFLNDGTGLAFESVPFGDARGDVYGLAIGDLDGDGLPDIAAGRSDAPNVVYFNRQSKRTALPSANAVTSFGCPAKY